MSGPSLSLRPDPSPLNLRGYHIAINRDWVYNQACILSHEIHVLAHSFITFNNLFKLIPKIRLSNNSFKWVLSSVPMHGFSSNFAY